MFSGDRGINLRQEELLREKRNHGIPEYEQSMNYSIPKQQQRPEHAPRRLPTQMEQKEQKRPSPRNNRKPFVLYVWGPEESNSKRALTIMKTTNISPIVSIVDVRSLAHGEVAPWLIGVPTLLSIEDKSVFRGTKCLDQILDIGEMMTRRREQERKQNQFMQREQELSKPPVMMMPQPQMRRQQEDVDPSVLPSFKEPEKENEKEKDDLKKHVEAIMARREKMMGVEKKKEDD
jgi:hypothetical protein